jgi:hypothetical protein
MSHNRETLISGINLAIMVLCHVKSSEWLSQLLVLDRTITPRDVPFESLETVFFL